MLKRSNLFIASVTTFALYFTYSIDFSTKSFERAHAENCRLYGSASYCPQAVGNACKGMVYHWPTYTILEQFDVKAASPENCKQIGGEKLRKHLTSFSDCTHSFSTQESCN